MHLDEIYFHTLQSDNSIHVHINILSEIQPVCHNDENRIKLGSN